MGKLIYLDDVNGEMQGILNSSAKFLYRLMPVDRCIELAKSNRWVFVSPTLWSDPYERAFLDAEFHFDSESYFNPFVPQKRNSDTFYTLFSQCWSLRPDTEAMWKGFAPNGDGVCMKISGANLKGILSDFARRRNGYDIYIGKVKYQNYSDLYDMKSSFGVWEDLRNGMKSEKVLELMLKKRYAYEPEREIRIFAVRRTPKTEPVVKLECDNVIERFEHLKFDPRMGEYLYNEMRTLFKGIKNGELPRVEQSGLYKKPGRHLYFDGRRPSEFSEELDWS